MNFDSFSHGQIQSKLWLCQNVEKYLTENTRVAILGCWYNVLGFLLCSRNMHKNIFITGIDIDKEAIEISNKICQAFTIQPNVRINNICVDANNYDLAGYNLVINCSVEHMESNIWFNNLHNETLICIQSSNVNLQDEIWDIKNPNLNFASLKNKFPLKSIYQEKTYHIKYENFEYDRFMLIGKK